MNNTRDYKKKKLTRQQNENKGAGRAFCSYYFQYQAFSSYNIIITWF